MASASGSTRDRFDAFSAQIRRRRTDRHVVSHRRAGGRSQRTLFAAAERRLPVELGTGWYIRGDLTFARENQPLLTPDLSQININKLRNNIGAGGGIGLSSTTGSEWM